jgi:predicted dehydrogenase
MRVAIVGLGAVGQRYAALLREIDHKVEIFTARRRKKRELISLDAQTSRIGNPLSEYSIVDVENLDNLIACKPDFAIVSSIPNLHHQDAKKFIAAGIPTIIEKPIGINSSEIFDLVELATRLNVLIDVPFVNRFHPLHAWIKERLLTFLDRSELAIASSVYKESLARMHPYEKPEDSYVYSHKSGGGALLSFCHELDFWNSLIGPLELHTFFQTVPSEADRADISTLLTLKSPSSNVSLISIDLDILAYPTQRFGGIHSEFGSLTWDWLNPNKSSYLARNPVLFLEVERLQLFRLFLLQFIDSVKNNKRFDASKVESSLLLAEILRERNQDAS